MEIMSNNILYSYFYTKIIWPACYNKNVDHIIDSWSYNNAAFLNIYQSQWPLMWINELSEMSSSAIGCITIRMTIVSFLMISFMSYQWHHYLFLWKIHQEYISFECWFIENGNHLECQIFVNFHSQWCMQIQIYQENILITDTHHHHFLWICHYLCMSVWATRKFNLILNNNY